MIDLTKLAAIFQNLDDKIVKRNSETPEGSIEESILDNLHEALSELIEEINDEADDE